MGEGPVDAIGPGRRSARDAEAAAGGGDRAAAPASVDWAARAAAAERAVVRRHLRRLGGVVPGTRIGRIRWPRLPPVRALLHVLASRGDAARLPRCRQA